MSKVVFGLVLIISCCWIAEGGRYDGPGYNGCGSGLTINPILEFIGERSLIKCCDAHDLCYGSCTSIKSVCDVVFLSCMLGECSHLKSWIFRQKCKLHAEEMAWAVRTFGFHAFNSKKCTKT